MLQNHMQKVGDAVAKNLPPKTGFIVLAFPIGGTPDDRLHYVSNARRKDALAVMTNFIRGNGWPDPRSN